MASAALIINDDGSASALVILTDPAEAPITTLTAWPAGVAQPVAAGADNGTVFTVTPVNPPVPSTDTDAPAGAFQVANIVPVTPPAEPLAQNVAFTVSIASGLTGQTAAITEPAGSLSLQADSSKPAGFSAALGTP